MKKLMISFMAFLGILSVSYSVVWHQRSKILKKEVDKLVDKISENSYAKIKFDSKITGFPFNMGVELTNISAKALGSINKTLLDSELTHRGSLKILSNIFASSFYIKSKGDVYWKWKSALDKSEQELKFDGDFSLNLKTKEDLIENIFYGNPKLKSLPLNYPDKMAALFRSLEYRSHDFKIVNVKTNKILVSSINENIGFYLDLNNEKKHVQSELLFNLDKMKVNYKEIVDRMITLSSKSSILESTQEIYDKLMEELSFSFSFDTKVEIDFYLNSKNSLDLEKPFKFRLFQKQSLSSLGSGSLFLDVKKKEGKDLSFDFKTDGNMTEDFYKRYVSMYKEIAQKVVLELPSVKTFMGTKNKAKVEEFRLFLNRVVEAFTPKIHEFKKLGLEVKGEVSQKKESARDEIDTIKISNFKIMIDDSEIYLNLDSKINFRNGKRLINLKSLVKLKEFEVLVDSLFSYSNKIFDLYKECQSKAYPIFQKSAFFPPVAFDQDKYKKVVMSLLDFLSKEDSNKERTLNLLLKEEFSGMSEFRINDKSMDVITMFLMMEFSKK